MYEIDTGQAVTQHGAICVSGRDARDFLNGQLSNDIGEVTAGRAQLTSLSNAQGRLLAVFYAVADGDDILLVTPRTLCTDVVAHLRRFVLRSDVIVSETDRRVIGAWGRADPGQAFDARRDSGRLHVVLDGGISRSISIAEPTAAANETEADWRRIEIACGTGWVYPQTSGRFVAQMLNLDLVDGISFTKGCYTGQEIIARMKHRGRVRRRMLRLTGSDCGPPAPGDAIFAGADKAGEIVDVVWTMSGVDLLAVVQLARWPGPFSLGQGGASLEHAALPYDIPEID